MQVMVNNPDGSRRFIDGDLVKKNFKTVIVRVEKNGKPKDIKRKISRDLIGLAPWSLDQ